MKKFAILLSLIFLLTGINACSKEETSTENIPEGTNLRVNYYTSRCTGEGVHQCLLIQEGKDLGTKNWTYFYFSIEGFDFEPGFVYNLEVQKKEIDNPPADGSSIKYSLIKLISKTSVNCEFENAIKDLEWLSFEIRKREADSSEFMQYCYISQAQVDTKIVFIYYDCNPRINKVISVYNCLGGRIGYLGGTVKKENLKNEKIIWKPNNFLCNL